MKTYLNGRSPVCVRCKEKETGFNNQSTYLSLFIKLQFPARTEEVDTTVTKELDS